MDSSTETTKLMTKQDALGMALDCLHDSIAEVILGSVRESEAVTRQKIRQAIRILNEMWDNAAY